MCCFSLECFCCLLKQKDSFFERFWKGELFEANPKHMCRFAGYCVCNDKEHKRKCTMFLPMSLNWRFVIVLFHSSILRLTWASRCLDFIIPMCCGVCFFLTSSQHVSCIYIVLMPHSACSSACASFWLTDECVVTLLTHIGLFDNVFATGIHQCCILIFTQILTYTTLSSPRSQHEIEIFCRSTCSQKLSKKWLVYEAV